MKTEKPVGDRVREVVEIMKKLRTLGIPSDAPEVAQLKSHFDAYIRDGECWSGSVSFLAYGRIADVNLPRRADKPIELTLRVPRVGGGL